MKLDMKFADSLAEYAEHGKEYLWEWLKDNCISGEASFNFNQSLFDGLELIERLVDTNEIRELFDELKDCLEGQITSLSFGDPWMNWLFSKLKLDSDSIRAIDKILSTIWDKLNGPEM